MKRADAVETNRVSVRRDPAADELAKQIAEMFPAAQSPMRRYPFFRAQGWYFDFAWPSLMIAADIVTINLLTPREKYSFAQSGGWRVFHFTPKEVRSGKAIEILSDALAHPPLFK